MRAMRSKALTIALALALAGSMLATTAFANGSIKGTIKSAQPAAPRPPRAVTKDPSVCGTDTPDEAVLVDKKGGLANVVVFLTDAKFEGKLAPVDGAALDQKGCRYAPHVQALTVGTPLSLLNNDAVLHNVHANDGTMTVFNVAMPIKGQKLPVPMRRPGLMKLQCDAGHAWMNGWVYVFDHPYYAVTNASGAFTIKDVPPGEYTVELWHEPIDGRGPGVRSTAKIKVANGAPAHLDFTMKL
jgi:plastocyanin